MPGAIGPALGMVVGLVVGLVVGIVVRKHKDVVGIAAVDIEDASHGPVRGAGAPEAVPLRSEPVETPQGRVVEEVPAVVRAGGVGGAVGGPLVGAAAGRQAALVGLETKVVGGLLVSPVSGQVIGLLQGPMVGLVVGLMVGVMV